MSNKPTREELVEKLKTPGWQMETGSKGFQIHGTLEELLEKTHARRASGEAPGLIRQFETGLELNMIQISELWEHLGLPI